MRAISQNGEVDLPYERIVVMQNFDNDVIVVTDELSKNKIVLGRYSSSEKAEKAIRMLRDAHKEYLSGEILLNGIGRTLMIVPNTDKSKEVADVAYETLKKVSYFQFPQDDEIEV